MRLREAERVEEETDCGGDLDAAVLSCQRRLSILREKHSPPARWFLRI
jgi:hypothetical protein